MLAGSVLWWLGGHKHSLLYGPGKAFVSIDTTWLWEGSNIGPRWPRVLLFIGVVLAFAVPLFLVVGKGGRPLRVVATLWTIPAAAAAAYASTLPRTTLAAGGTAIGTLGEDMRWPLLALGIQLAMTLPIVVGRSRRLWAAGSRAVAGLLAGGAAAAAALSVLLIVMGAQRIPWVVLGPRPPL